MSEEKELLEALESAHSSLVSARKIALLGKFECAQDVFNAIEWIEVAVNRTLSQE